MLSGMIELLITSNKKVELFIQLFFFLSIKYDKIYLTKGNYNEEKT